MEEECTKCKYCGDMWVSNNHLKRCIVINTVQYNEKVKCTMHIDDLWLKIKQMEYKKYMMKKYNH